MPCKADRQGKPIASITHDQKPPTQARFDSPIDNHTIQMQLSALYPASTLSDPRRSVTVFNTHSSNMSARHHP